MNKYRLINLAAAGLYEKLNEYIFFKYKWIIDALRLVGSIEGWLYFNFPRFLIVVWKY